MNSDLIVLKVEPSCCLFHLSQSIQKWVWDSGKGGLAVEMGAEDGEVAKWVRGLAALAFLPADQIPAAFNEYARNPDRPDSTQGVFRYFAATYVGYDDFGRWKTAMLPPNLWSVYQTTMQDKVPTRTNNKVEGHNNRLANLMPTHPTPYIFLEELQKESRRWDTKLLRLAAGEREQRSRSTWDAIDKRLKTLTEEGPIHGITVFLHAVSHSLSSRQVRPNLQPNPEVAAANIPQ